MRALSIRQPYAELILRGIKTIEYRSRPTRIIGERFWIYASKGKGRIEAPAAPVAAVDLRKVKSDNLSIAPPPPWMAELANALRLFPEALPTGVIVGSAVIERVSPPGLLEPDGMYRWHLTDVQRATRMRKPKGHPQPVWFLPF